MPKVRGKCKECGKTLEYWPSQMRAFCSLSCRSKWRVRTDAPPTKPRTGRYEPCVACGVEVWRTLSDQRTGARRFCSRSCRAAYARRNRSEFVCEACGDRFELKPSQAVHQAGRFCSRRCEGLARIERPLEREHNGKPARLDRHGYVWVWEPEHPEAKKYKGWIAEHRLIAEQLVGRRLVKSDEVHHVNRDRADNRPENLEVLDGLTHARITAQQRQTDRELLAKYIERFGPLD